MFQFLEYLQLLQDEVVSTLAPRDSTRLEQCFVHLLHCEQLALVILHEAYLCECPLSELLDHFEVVDHFSTFTYRYKRSLVDAAHPSFWRILFRTYLTIVSDAASIRSLLIRT